MIKALTKLVGKDEPTLIKALTDLIPKRDEDQESLSASNNIIPLRTSILSLLQLDDLVEDNSQLVKKTKARRITSQEDSDDWIYILDKLGKLIDNLHIFLSNLRGQEYYKNVYLELEEKEVERRHNILKEKLLDKTSEVEEVEAKTDITDKEKIEQLKKTLIGMGFTAAGFIAAGMPPPGAELDAATLAQVKASGADMIAAAHLATLEASSPQHVADVMQVILNRARGQSGGIPAVITAKEQFSPYSAAIYGTSDDSHAAAKYGHLGVTKAEIFELASQSNGLGALTQRFGAGNPSVAAQVLSDIRSNGPLITESRKFVGGATNFRGYYIPGSRTRPDGGNYYFSSGSIIIPELFNTNKIYYDTVRKPNMLSNFIVDKPTIMDMKDIGEPLIIIPLGRPIGRSILKMIFDKPFSIIENKFKVFSDKLFRENISKTDQKIPQQQTRRLSNAVPSTINTTPDSSQTATTRTEVKKTSESEKTPSYISKNAAISAVSKYIQDMNFADIISSRLSDDDFIPLHSAAFSPSVEVINKKTYIDNNISTKTDNLFNSNTKVVLLTQDIIYQEQ